MVRHCHVALTGEKEPNVGPALTLQDADGKQQNGVLVASPYEDARHLLVIVCEPIPWQEDRSRAQHRHEN